ncbi:ArnT family glycosyltransferase [Microvirga sp. 2MCAF38]|uniref:ArnT family glycosyltransferase n=1 Tax=Microvirga sp. 2MCAF38 TaxID=3232989 RepID=UPI003F94D5F9
MSKHFSVMVDNSWQTFARHNPIQTAVLLTAVLGFVLLALFQAAAPLQLDNMDFPAVAAATAKSGVPIYYRGEEHQNHSGLYHPPLYIYALAGWFKIFGPGPVSARMFDVVCAIGGGLILLQVVRAMFGSAKAWKIAPVFFVIYLLNPFALQAFSIVDIDTSIYVPLMMVVIWALVRIVFKEGELRSTPVAPVEFLLIALALTLCFWSKLTTTLILPAIVVAILSIRFGLIKSFLLGAALTIAAFGLFLATYRVYGWATGLDINYTFSFLLDTVSSKSAPNTSFSKKLAIYADRFRGNLIDQGRWSLYPIFACALAMASVLLWQVYRGKPAERPRSIAALSVLLLGFAIIAIYNLITGPYGGGPFKYIAPALPLLALASAALIQPLLKSFRSQSPRHLIIGAISAVLAFSLGLSWIRDAALLGELRFIWIGLLLPFGIAAVGSILASLSLQKGFVRGILGQFAWLAIIAVIAQGVGIAVYQVRADHATQYDYGQIGFNEVRNWVEQNTRPDEVIMSMKDVGFATGRRYLENYEWIYDPSQMQRLDQVVENLKIRVFIFTEGRGQDQLIFNPALEAWVSKDTTLKKIGHYKIYMRGSM